MRPSSRICLVSMLAGVLAASCSGEGEEAPGAGDDAATTAAADAASPGGGPDADTPAGPDAGGETPAPDASLGEPADSGPAAGLDASATEPVPDAAAPPADASAPEPGPDAGPTAPDASLPPGEDAGGLPTSPAVVLVGSQQDALASYLMNAFPPEWNIFWGASVPLGRHFDLDHVSYYTALRFASVPVPAGATVTDARLSFHPTNSVDSSHNLWLNVYAEKAADSAPFDPTNYQSGRPDQRLRTAAFIDNWLVRCNATCTDLSEYDCPQRKLDCWDPATPFTCPKNLKALVQEVVSLPGWAAGNAMTILVINSATDQDGTGYRDRRTIVGYDTTLGASFAPKLTIQFAP